MLLAIFFLLSPHRASRTPVRGLRLQASAWSSPTALGLALQHSLPLAKPNGWRAIAGGEFVQTNEVAETQFWLGKPSSQASTLHLLGFTSASIGDFILFLPALRDSGGSLSVGVARFKSDRQANTFAFLASRSLTQPGLLSWVLSVRELVVLARIETGAKAWSSKVATSFQDLLRLALVSICQGSHAAAGWCR